MIHESPGVTWHAFTPRIYKNKTVANLRHISVKLLTPARMSNLCQWNLRKQKHSDFGGTLFAPCDVACHMRERATPDNVHTQVYGHCRRFIWGEKNPSSAFAAFRVVSLHLQCQNYIVLTNKWTAQKTKTKKKKHAPKMKTSLCLSKSHRNENQKK